MKPFLLRSGNRIIEALSLGAIVWSTLALGAVWRLGFAIAFGLLAAAFCVWAGMRLLGNGDEDNGSGNSDTNRGPSSRSQRPLSRWTWVLGVALGGYFLLQILPLPTALVGILSPNRVTLEQTFREALDEPMPWFLALSVAPTATRRSLAVVAAAFMALVLGHHLAAKRRRARRIMGVLLALTLFEAFYGLTDALTGHALAFGFGQEDDAASGTFFNRNHFAGMLALFFPIVIGWFFYRAAAAQARVDRSRLLPATSWDVLGSQQAPWLLAPALLAMGIVQSQSRGGFSIMILTGALMFALGGQRKPLRQFGWIALALGLTMFAFAMASDYQAIFDRFGAMAQEGQSEGRLVIWRDSLGMFRDYPFFGVGLGNFPRVFMQYSSENTLYYPYSAHNEWLEGLTTLGLIGMALVTVTAFRFFVASFRRLDLFRDDRPWLLGCWCGLAGFAVHCFAEFSLHIPSIAILAFFLGGILLGFPAYKSSRRRRR